MRKSSSHRWSTQDSVEHYLLDKWGAPYFGVNADGHVEVRPRGADRGAIDLKTLVDELCARGISPPLLIRFNDLLESRLDELCGAFADSIAETGYRAGHQPLLPIKVNQQAHVVQELVERGRRHGLGLEAGSKAELLIAIALVNDDNSLIVCNGYKDRSYIETALRAKRIGKKTILVVDRFAELKLILDIADQTGIRPNLGIRIKLSTRGAGRWEESSGDNSKFGLSVVDVVRAIDQLKARDALDSLKLVHFHIGSQITAIRSVKEAVREATRAYFDIYRSGADKLEYLDVGGGLAVDYDGSQTNFHSSRNYSIEEYSRDIVAEVHNGAEQSGCPAPTLLTESGRAMVAHHSVLVVNVLGREQRAPRLDTVIAPDDDEHDVVHDMYEAFQMVSKKTYQEAHNDVMLLKDECATLFAHGVIDLRQRARAEEIFWATLRRIQHTVEQIDYVPEDLQHLNRKLSDTYYCNFSVFQSLPDAWAVDQLFPIAPIHRLDEEPTSSAILADLTCDSDGRVDTFIDLRDVRDSIRVHDLDEASPYYLGVFLVGAYQETLGDLHNLFGDTNAVHVNLSDDDKVHLEHVVEGDRIDEVLSYVEYDRSDLRRRLRRAVEEAVRAGRCTPEESGSFVRLYEEGLAGYTYLQANERRRKRATDTK